MKVSSLATRDFHRVLASGSRRRCDGVQVIVTPAPPGSPARLGMAVRASGAVTRNRARRRLRAAFRSCAAGVPCDVVIRADASAASMDYQDLERCIAAAISGTSS